MSVRGGENNEELSRLEVTIRILEDDKEQVQYWSHKNIPWANLEYRVKTANDEC